MKTKKNTYRDLTTSIIDKVLMGYSESYEVLVWKCNNSDPIEKEGIQDLTVLENSDRVFAKYPETRFALDYQSNPDNHLLLLEGGTVDYDTEDRAKKIVISGDKIPAHSIIEYQVENSEGNITVENKYILNIEKFPSGHYVYKVVDCGNPPTIELNLDYKMHLSFG